MTPSRTLRRAVGAAATTAGLLVVLAAPASAHVDASGASSPGGATTVTFTFDHGCGTSPTTSLRVQLPTGTTDVTADSPAGFAGTVTATEVDWSGGSVPNQTKGTFVATMRLTAPEGTRVYFPTIQGCAQGSNDWIEIPVAGQPAPEHVAPSIVVGKATPAADHDHGNETTATTAEHDHDGGGTSTTEAADHDHAKEGTTAAPATAAPATTPPGTSAPAANPASSNTGLIAGIIVAVVAVLAVIGVVIGRSRASKPGA